MMVKPLATVALITVPMAYAEGRAVSPSNVTLLCDVQTVEHLNCGGGLRAPNETPPDCRNFKSDRVVERRSKKVNLPRKQFHRGQFIYKDMIFDVGRTNIAYSTLPSVFTDAAGHSEDHGVCSVVTGNTAPSPRVKANK
jgi:hypothetical protein